MDKQRIQLTPEVIEALNEELAYTGTLVTQGRADQYNYGVEGQLLTLKEYTDRAISAWVNNPGQEQSLHELRKCAAIAIRALVVAGCPRRAAAPDATAESGNTRD